MHVRTYVYAKVHCEIQNLPLDLTFESITARCQRFVTIANQPSPQTKPFHQRDGLIQREPLLEDYMNILFLSLLLGLLFHIV